MASLMRITIPVAILTPLELVQIMMSPAKHPDGEGKLEVWISDCHTLVEDTFHSLLGP